jgi:hypothetical protein
MEKEKENESEKCKVACLPPAALQHCSTAPPHCLPCCVTPFAPTMAIVSPSAVRSLGN